MVSRHSLLIILLAGLFLPVTATASSRCLRCHPPHYANKGTCTGCHGGNDRTERKRVAHDRLVPGRYSWSKIAGSPVVERGTRQLETLACRRCHTIGKKGNRLAGNLDTVPLVRQPEEMAEAIRKPVRQMPDFRLDDETVTALVNAILAGTAPSKHDEPPVVVHFSRAPKQENLFEKKCGACHRMLTGRKGGLGSGRIGPDLSGLLTPFYPKTFREGSRWSAERLKEWIENPRKIRRQTTMQPVAMNNDEWDGIRRLFER